MRLIRPVSGTSTCSWHCAPDLFFFIPHEFLMRKTCFGTWLMSKQIQKLIFLLTYYGQVFTETVLWITSVSSTEWL